MFTVEAITSRQEFTRAAVFWNGLLAQSDLDVPFMSFEWFSFFWDRYCACCQPLILILRDAGKPVAAVPLARQKMRWRGLPVMRLGFLANYFSIRTGIISAVPDAGEIAETVFRYLKGSRIGFDIFAADLIVKGSLTDRVLGDYVRRHGLGVKAMKGDENPCIPVRGTWEDYVTSRSRNLRSDIRQLAKQYENKAAHSVRTCSDCGFDEACAQMFRISSDSWKYREGSAICNDPVKMDFYRRFLDVAGAAGWLRLKILEIGGEPAAFSYELHYAKRMYIMKIGFSERFGRMKPGMFMMHRSIREAFDSGFTECELLGKAEDWKLRLCDCLREHVKYWIFNDSPYGRLLQMWENSVVATAKKLVTKSPSL